MMAQMVYMQYKTIENGVADAAHDLGVLLSHLVYGRIDAPDVEVAGILYHMFGFDDDWLALIAGCDGVCFESVQELAREELARQLVQDKWVLEPAGGNEHWDLPGFDLRNAGDAIRENVRRVAEKHGFPLEARGNDTKEEGDDGRK